MKQKRCGCFDSSSHDATRLTFFYVEDFGYYLDILFSIICLKQVQLDAGSQIIKKHDGEMETEISRRQLLAQNQNKATHSWTHWLRHAPEKIPCTVTQTTQKPSTFGAKTKRTAARQSALCPAGKMTQTVTHYSFFRRSAAGFREGPTIQRPGAGAAEDLRSSA